MYKLRPIYHFLPEKNWMNDPNGTIYYLGEHQIFYQYNPFGSKWNHMHWGHAKSKDLVHWERLPIALFPHEDMGELHCFSGCCAVQEGHPVIIYTSVGHNGGSPTAVTTEENGEIRKNVLEADQRMALGEDNLVNWKRHSNRPLMEHTMHNGIDVKEWRDPFVWKEGNDWFMLLAGVCGSEGCIFMYRSSDLMNWEYLNTLYKEEGHVLECPNIVKFGSSYILIFSVTEEQRVRYCTGTMKDDYTLKVEKSGVLDYGEHCYYATNISVDDKDRVLLWGWMNEAGRGEFDEAGEWAGVQSIPRVLQMNEAGSIELKPIPEISSIRYQKAGLNGVLLENEVRQVEFQGKAFEIDAEFEINQDTGSFGLKLLCSPDGKEQTVLKFDMLNKTFSLNRDKASISPKVKKGEIRGCFNPKAGVLSVKILVDFSTIEVFVNEESCMSARVYPLLEDSQLLYIYSDDRLKINRFDVWKMKSIW
jgi:beta-fructofuranosidase